MVTPWVAWVSTEHQITTMNDAVVNDAGRLLISLARTRYNSQNLKVGAVATGELIRMRCSGCGVTIKGTVAQFARIRSCPRCGGNVEAMAVLPPQASTASSPQPQSSRSPTTPVRVHTRANGHGVHSAGIAIPKPKSQYSASPRFVGSDDFVVAFGHTLNSPLIYVANTRKYGGFDASLLCLQREIAPPRLEPPKSLGYWPQTSELKPHQIGNYVQWLAGDRSDPSIDIGYVFLYFYGLERRALVDKQDIEPIAKEVLRLLSIYGTQSSFRQYAAGLLTHMVLIRWLKPTPKLIAKLISLYGKSLPENLRHLILGHHAREGLALSPDVALALASTDELAMRSTVTLRAKDELSELFKKKYAAKFSGGITPLLGEKGTLIEYHPGSPTLLWHQHRTNPIPSAQWPTIKQWRATFNPVVALWNECVVELKQYARKLNTHGKDSAVAFEALPATLQGDRIHPSRKAWDVMLVEFVPESGSILAPIGRIAALRDIEQRKTLTGAQSRSLVEFVETMGSSLEPDVRITGKNYGWNDHVAIIRLPDTPTLPQDRKYELASIIVRLAMEVALADGALDPAERQVMVNFFENRLELSRNDCTRITALMDVLTHENASKKALKRSTLADFTPEQRESIGRFLADIATAVGGVSDAEQRALERHYKALGLDKKRVAALLVELGERSPASALAGDEISIEAVSLDLNLDRVRALREESEHAAKILLDAISTEESPVEKGTSDETVSPVATISTQTSNGVWAALRSDMHPFAFALVTQASWPRTELDALARQHGTSLAAAVELINAWADEHLGDFLIEDGESIILVNMSLVNVRT